MIAALLAVVLASLAALHVYWACGGQLASGAVLPHVEGRPLFTPSRAATIAVAVGLAAAASLALMAGHLLASPLPAPLVRWAAVALGVVFLARAVGDFRVAGYFKRVRDTTFAVWDTWLYSPLCVLIGVGFLVIAAT